MGLHQCHYEIVRKVSTKNVLGKAVRHLQIFKYFGLLNFSTAKVRDFMEMF